MGCYGNIFDLGTKYTDAFGMNFTAEDGTSQRVLMGCYGIGTTRLVGSIVETHHDDRGIIWPKSVAPFQVHLVSLRSKDADVQATIDREAQDLYEGLKATDVEVLWDDRADVSPGEKFADADLIGIPLRLVVSEKTLKEGAYEWKLRAGGEARLVKKEDALEAVVAWGKE
jgi:prolyl-tRNA synthetase